MASPDPLRDSIRGAIIPRTRQLFRHLCRHRPEIAAIEGLLQQLLGALFADRLATSEPRTGEKNLLVEAQASPADENETGHGDGERLVKVRDNHGADPLERAVTAPESGSQPTGGALQKGTPEMHVDDVRVLREHLRGRTQWVAGVSGRGGYTGRG